MIFHIISCISSVGIIYVAIRNVYGLAPKTAYILFAVLVLLCSFNQILQ